MNNKKGRKELFSAKSYWFWIALLMLLVLILFFAKYKIPLQTSNVTPTPNTQETSIDNVDDGTYSNNSYKFQFTYPEEKFMLVSSSADSATWTSKNKTGEGNSKDVSIYLTVTVDKNDREELYENLYNLKQGQTLQIKHDLLTKMESKDNGSFKVVTSFVKTKPDAEVEHVVGYKAFILKDNQAPIVISLFTSPTNEKDVLMNKNVFQEIVDSFIYF